MKKSLLLIILAAMLLSHCKVVKYTPDKLPLRQLSFGNGGGFAGIETTYTLLENGQLFKQVGISGNYEELKAISPKKAKALFSDAKTLQLFKLDIDKPGNLYYFVREKNELLDSKVTWGAGDYLPPQGLVSLYRELSAQVKGREVIATGKKADLSDEEKEKIEQKKKGELGW